MSITLIALTIRIDKNFFFEGRSIRRDSIVCQTEFDGQTGSAQPGIGGDHYELEGCMPVKIPRCRSTGKSKVFAQWTQEATKNGTLTKLLSSGSPRYKIVVRNVHNHKLDCGVGWAQQPTPPRSIT